MGLFTFRSGLNAKTFLTNKKNALSGIFRENYISTELAAHDRKLFYQKGKRDSELEFLLEYDGRMMSIDAKKSKGSFDSLDEFRLYIALKVSTNQYGYEKESKILTVPYYYFSFLLDSGFDEYAWLLNIKRLSVSGFP